MKATDGLHTGKFPQPCKKQLQVGFISRLFEPEKNMMDENILLFCHGVKILR